MVNKILMAMFVTAAVAFAPIAATAQTGAAPAKAAPEKTMPEKTMPEKTMPMGATTIITTIIIITIITTTITTTTITPDSSDAADGGRSLRRRLFRRAFMGVSRRRSSRPRVRSLAKNENHASSGATSLSKFRS